MVKEEIKRIVDLNKSGKITDDQMAELLSELTTNDEPRESQAKQQNAGGLGNLFSQVSDIVGSLSILEEGDNSSVMSKINVPKQDNIKDNSYNLSKIDDLIVNEGCCFRDNTVNASNLSTLNLAADSKIKDCDFNATNINDLSLSGSELRDIQFNASKLKGTRFNESLIRDLQLNACTMTNCSFENCEWGDVQFNKAKLENVTFRNISLKDVEISLKKLSDLEINSLEELQKHL